MERKVWRWMLVVVPPCAALMSLAAWRKHVALLRLLQAHEEMLQSAEDNLKREMEKVRLQLMSDDYE